jgi:asparagine synthase (glutamine-hydrolysing)
MAMPPSREDVPALRGELDSALEKALDPFRASTGRLGVLFSGGVDSALIAWELRTRPKVLLCTLGREGSPDLGAGRAGAERLGLAWQALPVDPDHLKIVTSRFEKELAGASAVARTVLVSLALAIEQAEPDLLVCGQGADELFLGYAHYRGLDGPEAERRSRDDLGRLRESDWPRTQRIAEKVGKTILAPYLSPAFEEAALRVPIALRLPGDRPKRFFREWAIERGLPAELADRPKKALQYGTGVSTLLRSQGRRDG